MILQRWDANGKIDIFSKWLGPPVNMYQFVKGPVIDEQRLQLAQTPGEDIPMLNIWTIINTNISSHKLSFYSLFIILKDKMVSLDGVFMIIIINFWLVYIKKS